MGHHLDDREWIYLFNSALLFYVLMSWSSGKILSLIISAESISTLQEFLSFRFIISFPFHICSSTFRCLFSLICNLFIFFVLLSSLSQTPCLIFYFIIFSVELLFPQGISLLNFFVTPLSYFLLVLLSTSHLLTLKQRKE